MKAVMKQFVMIESKQYGYGLNRDHDIGFNQMQTLCDLVMIESGDGIIGHDWKQTGPFDIYWSQLVSNCHLICLNLMENKRITFGSER